MGKFVSLEITQQFKRGFYYYFYIANKLAVNLRIPRAEAVQQLLL